MAEANIHHCVALLLVLSSLVCANYTEEDDVLVLTQDNFERALTEFPSLLVEFYAPWCGHCKALAPEYANVARLVKHEMKDVRLAKVDATVEMELAKKYEVSGYPTIKLFHAGKIINYEAGRNTHDFVTFLRKKLGPIVVTVDSVDAARATADSEDLVIFGFFLDMSSSAAKAFLEAAEENDDTTFAVASSAEILGVYGIRESGVVAFKKYDEGRVDLKGDITLESINKFLLQNALPLVNEYKPEAAQKLFGGPVKRHLIMFLSRKDENFQKLVKELEGAATGFKGKVLFIYMNIDDDENLQILNFFGLKAAECPTIRYVSLAEDLVKFKPDSADLSALSMQEFVQNVLDGKLRPHLLSEKLSEDWDANPVKVLVGENFHDVVNDKTRDVFVMFYAPWCGHCKILLPIWDELAKKYENKTDLVIAKIDATTNEIADMKVESFPTIKFYPRDGDEAKNYYGDRTLEALVKFIESNGEVHYRKEDKENKQPKDEL